MSMFEGSAWQERMEADRERQAKHGKSGCGHPGCDIEDEADRIRGPECVLEKPLMLSVPAGRHVHLECRAHPEGHVIRGSSVTL